MKLGIISDTHDRLPTFEAAMQLFKEERIDVLLHAGDYVAPFAAKFIAPEQLNLPLFSVYGNNDGEREGLKKLLPGIVDGPLHFELAGWRIVMDHYIDWLKPDDIAAADIVVTGHTHQISEQAENGKTLLNPGECCGWVTGRATVMTLSLPEKSDMSEAKDELIPKVEVFDLL